jgi:hypothetical protein
LPRALFVSLIRKKKVKKSLAAELKIANLSSVPPLNKMRIQKTLSRTSPFGPFFRAPDFSICEEFTEKLSVGNADGKLIARYSLAVKNPKKKGFKKVTFDLKNRQAILKGKKFQILGRQEDKLKSFQIADKKDVWMKVELA